MSVISRQHILEISMFEIVEGILCCLPKRGLSQFHTAVRYWALLTTLSAGTGKSSIDFLLKGPDSVSVLEERGKAPYPSEESDRVTD